MVFAGIGRAMQAILRNPSAQNQQQRVQPQPPPQQQQQQTQSQPQQSSVLPQVYYSDGSSNSAEFEDDDKPDTHRPSTATATPSSTLHPTTNTNRQTTTRSEPPASAVESPTPMVIDLAPLAAPAPDRKPSGFPSSSQHAPPGTPSTTSAANFCLIGSANDTHKNPNPSSSSAAPTARVTAPAAASPQPPPSPAPSASNYRPFTRSQHRLRQQQQHEQTRQKGNERLFHVPAPSINTTSAVAPRPFTLREGELDNASHASLRSLCRRLGVDTAGPKLELRQRALDALQSHNAAIGEENTAFAFTSNAIATDASDMPPGGTAATSGAASASDPEKASSSKATATAPGAGKKTGKHGAWADITTSTKDVPDARDNPDAAPPQPPGGIVAKSSRPPPPEMRHMERLPAQPPTDQQMTIALDVSSDFAAAASMNMLPSPTVSCTRAFPGGDVCVGSAAGGAGEPTLSFDPTALAEKTGIVNCCSQGLASGPMPLPPSKSGTVSARDERHSNIPVEDTAAAAAAESADQFPTVNSAQNRAKLPTYTAFREQPTAVRPSTAALTGGKPSQALSSSASPPLPPPPQQQAARPPQQTFRSPNPAPSVSDERRIRPKMNVMHKFRQVFRSSMPAPPRASPLEDRDDRSRLTNNAPTIPPSSTNDPSPTPSVRGSLPPPPTQSLAADRPAAAHHRLRAANNAAAAAADRAGADHRTFVNNFLDAPAPRPVLRSANRLSAPVKPSNTSGLPSASDPYSINSIPELDSALATEPRREPELLRQLAVRARIEKSPARRSSRRMSLNLMQLVSLPEHTESDRFRSSRHSLRQSRQFPSHNPTPQQQPRARPQSSRASFQQARRRVFAEASVPSSLLPSDTSSILQRLRARDASLRAQGVGKRAIPLPDAPPAKRARRKGAFGDPTPSSPKENAPVPEPASAKADTPASLLPPELAGRSRPPRPTPRNARGEALAFGCGPRRRRPASVAGPPVQSAITEAQLPQKSTPTFRLKRVPETDVEGRAELDAELTELTKPAASAVPAKSSEPSVDGSENERSRDDQDKSKPQDRSAIPVFSEPAPVPPKQASPKFAPIVFPTPPAPKEPTKLEEQVPKENSQPIFTFSAPKPAKEAEEPKKETSAPMFNIPGSTSTEAGPQAPEPQAPVFSFLKPLEKTAAPTAIETPKSISGAQSEEDGKQQGLSLPTTFGAKPMSFNATPEKRSHPPQSGTEKPPEAESKTSAVPTPPIFGFGGTSSTPSFNFGQPATEKSAAEEKKPSETADTGFIFPAMGKTTEDKPSIPETTDSEKDKPSLSTPVPEANGFKLPFTVPSEPKAADAPALTPSEPSVAPVKPPTPFTFPTPTPAQSTQTPSFSFGAPPTENEPNAETPVAPDKKRRASDNEPMGTATPETKPFGSAGFSFGSTESVQPAPTPFGSSSAATPKQVTFAADVKPAGSATRTDDATKKEEEQEKPDVAAGFSFGKAAPSTPSAPAPASAGPFSDAKFNTPSTQGTGFVFGATPAPALEEKPPPLAIEPPKPATTFSSSAGQGFKFGGPPSTPTSQGPSSTPAFGSGFGATSQAQGSSGGFQFGASVGSATPTTSAQLGASSSSFNPSDPFGSTNNFAAASPFGAPANAAPAQANAAPAFGAVGIAPSTPVFGGGSIPAFGSTPTAGAAAAPPFGAPPAGSNPFGAPAAATPFGQNAAQGGAGGMGGAPGAGGFGNPPPEMAFNVQGAGQQQNAAFNVGASSKPRRKRLVARRTLR